MIKCYELMKVFNQTQKTYISNNLKTGKSFSDKLFGLLLTSNIGSSILFRTRFGIHTFGLKRIIEVIVLDNKLKVVKIGTVKPNRTFFWNPLFSIVLEVPEGSIKKSKTKIGDILKLKF